MAILLLVVRVLLAATFMVSGIAKLLDRLGSRKSLQDFGVPVFLAVPLAFLLPIAELTCAIALIPDASVQMGAIGVSGAPRGDADEACAIAGVKAIADSLEF